MRSVCGLHRQLHQFFGLAGLFCLLAESAHAHALAIYVSTPITPPFSFLWVPIIFVALLLFLNAWLARHLWQIPWSRCRAVILSRISIALFCFVLAGWLFAEHNTAPPPGLGPPCRVLWGLGWHEVGWLFIIANLCGLFAISCAASSIARGLGKPNKRELARFRAANIGVYLLCLLPYTSTGALTHGWAGRYVYSACWRNLDIMSMAVMDYCRQHDGQLPAATSVEELYAAVKEYLRIDMQHDRIHTCPLGRSFYRNPKPYEWNVRLSGRYIQKLEPESLNQPLFSCANHAVTIWDATTSYFNLGNILRRHASMYDKLGDPLVLPDPLAKKRQQELLRNP